MNTTPEPTFLCMTSTADFYVVLVMKPVGLDAVALTGTTSALTWFTHVQGGRNIPFRMLLMQNVFLYRQG